MGKIATDDQIAVVRSIVGDDATEMDIIRALHMANNDAAAAINILFDAPPKKNPSPNPPCKSKNPPLHPIQYQSSDDTSICSSEGDWWLVGSTELTGLSTCKGRRIKEGDKVTFSFPHSKTSSFISPSSAKASSRLTFRGRLSAASCSEIVRFSTEENGEIGRIPNEWARCLVPLVKEKKIRIDGSCKYAPQVLGIMDTVLLSVSIYINSSMFRKQQKMLVKTTSSAMTEASTVHPLPALFRLLGLTAFKKAEFCPEDLYSRKRSIESMASSGVTGVVLPSEKCRKLPFGSCKENNDDESLPNPELQNIAGLADSSHLEEMIPPVALQCELRSYQRQALHWMVQVEKGRCLEEAATTLHPCWDAYLIADKRKHTVYLNAFTGDASIEFPSTLQISRGGILADAMGLGKTIMTIALLLTHSGKGGLSTSFDTQASAEANDAHHISNQFSNISKKSKRLSDFNKLLKSEAPLVGGGNLIICPMTLLGQWKAEIETQVQPNSLTVYVHYGQSRPRDAKFLAQNDVVLTTYGVLASEFSSENSEDNGGLYSVQWFRIVLDEAHTIKSSKSQISRATAALVGDRRWCLTGTPIQFIETSICWKNLNEERRALEMGLSVMTYEMDDGDDI